MVVVRLSRASTAGESRLVLGRVATLKHEREGTDSRAAPTPVSLADPPPVYLLDD